MSRALGSASDPAVAAARRSLDATFKAVEPSPPLRGMLSEVAEDAARAALAPLRAKIEAISNEYGGDDNVSQFVLGLLDRLTPYVYPEEEL